MNAILATASAAGAVVAWIFALTSRRTLMRAWSRDRAFVQWAQWTTVKVFDRCGVVYCQSLTDLHRDRLKYMAWADPVSVALEHMDPYDGLAAVLPLDGDTPGRDAPRG